MRPWAGGALGVVIVIAAPSVIGVVGVFDSVLSASLFMPVAGGLYVPGRGPVLTFVATGGL